MVDGNLRNGEHVLPVRVYWEDTDAAGIVYYANYLKFIERGRSDMLALAGVDQRRLLAEAQVAFAVRSCAIEYLAPAYLEDRLEVRTWLTGWRGAAIDLSQSVYRNDDELARAKLRLACIDAKGRPKRLPQVVIAALATLSPSLSANSSIPT